ncbi:MAG: sugar-binding domain-containing protein, partial [bacterium]
MLTRWAADVSPANVHPEYPRPTMARPEWLNLNGLWDFALAPAADLLPAAWAGNILVPFPVESALSGVARRVGAGERLWYRRRFTVPPAWAGKRVLLHFDAVDWEAEVRVNGREAGTHRGGYDRFTFDVTDALRPAGEQEVTVAVRDPADGGPQPRGKQVRAPEGIFYTPVTGIWQTVWLEPVPESNIEQLRVIPDLPRGEVALAVKTTEGGIVEAVVRAEGRELARARGSAGLEFTIDVPSPRRWTPDDPFLYDLEVLL